MFNNQNTPTSVKYNLVRVNDNQTQFNMATNCERLGMTRLLENNFGMARDAITQVFNTVECLHQSFKGQGLLASFSVRHDTLQNVKHVCVIFQVTFE
jgi:hypothetical protein